MQQSCHILGKYEDYEEASRTLPYMYIRKPLNAKGLRYSTRKNESSADKLEAE